ncbi:MAG: O-antigen ligase family protein [Flavobacteriales bacterium]
MYIVSIMLHVLIGILVYFNEALAKFYFLFIVIYFLNRIVRSPKNKMTVEVLSACAYMVGAEVFLRMNHGTFFYEASKYLIIIYVLLGIISNGVSRKAIIYVVYLLLLIPGIFVAVNEMGFETNIRKAVAFNLSGPVCLGLTALFCYKRNVSVDTLKVVITLFLLPLISMAVYLFLYTPNLQEVVTDTGSNFEASGGFGPNQVATVLGIGLFAATVRFFIVKGPRFYKAFDLLLLGLMGFRALVTFSRGGVLTALVMIAFFVLLYYFKVNLKTKFRIKAYLIIFVLMALVTWMVSSIQTSGFLDKRYANQDAAGREKEDVTTGRVDLLVYELSEFMDNPFLGIGVGKIKEIRKDETGVEAASHNEMSRIIAEHGLLGVIAFLILLITPLVFRFTNRSNLFFYSFYLFWFLTINHSAMRIAAPAFIYGLCLLNITYESKTQDPRLKIQNPKTKT